MGILTTEKVPEWVESRLKLVFEAVASETFEVFIQTIIFSDSKTEANAFEAYAVTDDSLIKINASLETVTTVKFKKENIEKVEKKFVTSDDDILEEDNAICHAIELIFKDGKTMRIYEPTYKGQVNLTNYRNFANCF